MTDTLVMTPAENEARRRATVEMMSLDPDSMASADWDGIVSRHLIDVNRERSEMFDANAEEGE